MLLPITMVAFILNIQMVCTHKYLYLNQTTEGNVLIPGRQTYWGYGEGVRSKAVSFLWEFDPPPSPLHVTFDLRIR